jgi:hypothetical protein
VRRLGGGWAAAGGSMGGGIRRACSLDWASTQTPRARAQKGGGFADGGHPDPGARPTRRDVALLPHPSFGRRGAPLDPLPRPFRPCDEESLAAAVGAVAEWLATKKQPLIVVGRQARCARARAAESRASLLGGARAALLQNG